MFKLLRPVSAVYPITQVWGVNPHIYVNAKGHNGVDFGCPNGTPVYCSADGVVTLAGLDSETAKNPNRGYGKHVRIQYSENKWLGIYGHFQSINVKSGDKVKMGQTIGYSNNTGMSTGSHVHWELRKGAALATHCDPLPYMIDSIPSGESGNNDDTINTTTSALFTIEIKPDITALNFRSGPGTEFSVIRVLSPGERMNVVQIIGDVWLQTETNGYIKFNPEWVKVVKYK